MGIYSSVIECLPSLNTKPWVQSLALKKKNREKERKGTGKKEKNLVFFFLKGRHSGRHL